MLIVDLFALVSISGSLVLTTQTSNVYRQFISLLCYLNMRTFFLTYKNIKSLRVGEPENIFPTKPRFILTFKVGWNFFYVLLHCCFVYHIFCFVYHHWIWDALCCDKMPYKKRDSLICVKVAIWSNNRNENKITTRTRISWLKNVYFFFCTIKIFI